MPRIKEPPHARRTAPTGAAVQDHDRHSIRAATFLHMDPMTAGHIEPVLAERLDGWIKTAPDARTPLAEVFLHAALLYPDE